MPEARAHILVAGYVQGVGYRHFVVRTAQRLGLSGTVRNLPDGSVDVVAEGPRETILTLIQELKQGPSVASVDNVAVTWEKASGGFSGFSIEF